MHHDEPGQKVRPATLKDVAALAGVSVATASKALTGGYRISVATQERVRKSAESLSFAPNRLAQSLHSSRTGTVGLLTSDLDGRFSIPVMMGAEDAFGTGQVSVLLCDARGDAIREQHHVRTLLGRRVDGLIVVGDTTNPRSPLVGDIPVPVVYAYSPSTNAEDVSVVSDNVDAGRAAAQHLLECGRRNIAYISGDPQFVAARDRIDGAAAVLAERGLRFAGGEALFGAWSEEWGRGAIRTLLASDPRIDGVLCGSDHIARGVLDALRELGREVPEEISVMGHDNWEIIATQSRPPLSTIDMDLEQVGRLAARLLFASIDGSPQPGVHLVGTHVVLRGSTAPGR